MEPMVVEEIIDETIGNLKICIYWMSHSYLLRFVAILVAVAESCPLFILSEDNVVSIQLHIMMLLM
jgi:hypothetical protein